MPTSFLRNGRPEYLGNPRAATIALARRRKLQHEKGLVEARVEDAFEVVAGNGPVLVTCEHASERFPEPWTLPEADHWLMGTHWAFDIGAADLARELAIGLGCPAVLSRFSRLLADPNRAEDANDLFLASAEGRPVTLNQELTPNERTARLDALWRPYHDAIEAVIAADRPRIVFAVHTFTPVFGGVRREVEVGVLFDEEVELAEKARAVLEPTGLEVRMNQPYSGKGGLMESARRHALAHGLRALEIELRQDLAIDVHIRRRVIDALVPLLCR